MQDLLSNRKRLLDILARIDKKLKKNPLDAKIGYLEVQTLTHLDKNIETHWNLLNKSPMVAAFNKFVQENIIDARLKQFKDRNEVEHMPLIPPGM